MYGLPCWSGCKNMLPSPSPEARCPDILHARAQAVSRTGQSSVQRAVNGAWIRQELRLTNVAHKTTRHWKEQCAKPVPGLRLLEVDLLGYHKPLLYGHIPGLGARR